jgi:hypothetical protein
MLPSENNRVKFLTLLAALDNLSSTRRNLNYIATLCNFDIGQMLETKPNFVMNSNNDWRCKLINEIIDIRDNEVNIDFEFTELSEILEVITTENN